MRLPGRTRLALLIIPRVKEDVRQTRFLAGFFITLLTAPTHGAPIEFEPNIPIVFVDTQRPLQIGQPQKGSVRVIYPKGNQARDTDTEKLTADVKYHGAVSLSYEKK